ncbi:MAG: hypothetical protein KDE56_21500 [Anaerolineales bacterium]|nr:hypothetical protein [Anaerolineales bacterium]
MRLKYYAHVGDGVGKAGRSRVAVVNMQRYAVGNFHPFGQVGRAGGERNFGKGVGINGRFSKLFCSSKSSFSRRSIVASAFIVQSTPTAAHHGAQPRQPIGRGGENAFIIFNRGNNLASAGVNFDRSDHPRRATDYLCRCGTRRGKGWPGDTFGAIKPATQGAP